MTCVPQSVFHLYLTVTVVLYKYVWNSLVWFDFESEYSLLAVLLVEVAKCSLFRSHLAPPCSILCLCLLLLYSCCLQYNNCFVFSSVFRARPSVIGTCGTPASPIAICWARGTTASWPIRIATLAPIPESLFSKLVLLGVSLSLTHLQITCKFVDAYLLWDVYS